MGAFFAAEGGEEVDFGGGCFSWGVGAGYHDVLHAFFVLFAVGADV